MVNDERLKGIKNLSEHFTARKDRAAKRLNTTPEGYWYFAILGLKTEVDSFEFDSLAKLQEVSEPPGAIEIAGALRDKVFFNAISRYSSSFEFELAVPRNSGNSEQAAFNLAWWIISALRVKTLAEILIPAVSDYSWSTMAAIDGQCHAQLLEDVPQAKRLAEPIEITSTDLGWVVANLNTFSELLETPKFRLAVETLTTHHFQNSERMVVAALWAGIEALFEVQSELRFRLSALIASMLEPRGKTRLELYRRAKKLYDVRSKAVHGSPLSRTQIHEHVIEVRKILSQLLCKSIESKKVPTEQDFDDYMFC